MNCPVSSVPWWELPPTKDAPNLWRLTRELTCEVVFRELQALGTRVTAEWIPPQETHR